MESIDKITPALVRALSEMGGAAKDGKNPHFRNEYATLESVVNTARPVLAAHDLAFTQNVPVVDGEVKCSTTLWHTSGQFVVFECNVPVAKRDPQGVGSAITYARRYGLMAALGIPAIDDDAEAAHGRGQGAMRNGLEPTAPAQKSASQAKKDGDMEAFKAEIDLCETKEELEQWAAKRGVDIQALPGSWQKELRDYYATKLQPLIQSEGEAV